ncbi:uncharacterized protein LOC111397623 [Olea europaea var. sylvestris]|uniref:uncharacterized protein LOC111397623 n=1 Tax=Olea europaea var. sylvestris TaxID=158386 RepID=UPI000C1CDEA6|nr:uncharacterized protein LOC111397623 [Olea europaea var. sylvestris]
MTSKIWKIFMDGASNNSSSGTSVIITSPDRSTEIQCALRSEFEATNNGVEYEAIFIASEFAKNLELEHVKTFSDSQLVVGQIEGSFERKDEKMNLYCLKVHDLQRIVHIKMVTEPSITQKTSVMDIDHEPSWMDPIVEFISSGNLPSDPRVARSIRSRAARYCIIGGILFRRSFTLPYLRCLKSSESLQALTEVHEGVCGNHQGARVLAYKLISSFQQWRVDILGPFPLARGQLKFVAVVVEYFTKWVEAESLATLSEPKLRSFIWKSIVCRFGVSKVLITDNGRIGDAKNNLPDELPSILWAYKISHKTATGETPFMLAFGLEATIPINLATIKKFETNVEEQTTEHLDLLEEVREQASLRTANY